MYNVRLKHNRIQWGFHTRSAEHPFLTYALTTKVVHRMRLILWAHAIWIRNWLRNILAFTYMYRGSSQDVSFLIVITGWLRQLDSVCVARNCGASNNSVFRLLWLRASRFLRLLMKTLYCSMTFPIRICTFWILISHPFACISNKETVALESRWQKKMMISRMRTSDEP